MTDVPQPSKTRGLVKHLLLAGLLLLIMIELSRTIGLGRTGFDSTSILNQFFFYAGPAVGSLVGVLILYAASAFSKGDKRLGSSVSFASPGELPSPFSGISKSQFRIFLVSIAIFFVFGLYLVYSNQSFTGVGQLGKQQFAVVDSILYSSALIPAAENLGVAFIWAFCLFWLRREILKRNWGKTAFIILSIIAAMFVFGLYGVFNHLLRYGSSDVAIFNVLLFWTMGGLITVLTGSFIPFWVMHISNNLFFDLAKYYNNDVILGFTLVSIVVVTLLYAVVLYIRRGKKEKQNELA